MWSVTWWTDVMPAKQSGPHIPLPRVPAESEQRRWFLPSTLVAICRDYLICIKQSGVKYSRYLCLCGQYQFVSSLLFSSYCSTCHSIRASLLCYKCNITSPLILASLLLNVRVAKTPFLFCHFQWYLRWCALFSFLYTFLGVNPKRWSPIKTEFLYCKTNTKFKHGITN